jgi:hypothetical protein
MNNEFDIKNASSDALLQMVSIYKKVKINKELAKKCMLEISVRENNGEIFDYNKFDKKADLLNHLNDGFLILFNEDLLTNIKDKLNYFNISYIKVSDKEIFINTPNNHEDIKSINSQIEIKQYKESLQDDPFREK